MATLHLFEAVMKHTGALALASALVLVRAQRTNILITNDDGWTVANVRAQNDALKAAGYDVSCLRCCPSRSYHCGLLPFPRYFELPRSRQVWDGVIDCYASRSDYAL